MTKVNSKLCCGLVLGGVLLAIGAFAAPSQSGSRSGSAAKTDSVTQNGNDQSNGNGTNADKGSQSQNMCGRISDLAAKFDQRVGDQKKQAEANQEKRMNQWTERIGRMDSEIGNMQSEWDANRQEQYSKLEQRAETDDQKKAASQFEETVEKAVTARREAVEAANNQFREQVRNAIQTRTTERDGLISGYDEKRSAALAEAENGCASGGDALAIRTALRTKLQAAKTELDSDRKNGDKTGEQVRAVVETRNQAVKKAMDNFKAVMEQARIELRKAFPSDVTSENDTDKTATPQ